MVSPNKNYFAKGTFVLFKLFYYYFSLLKLITLFYFIFLIVAPLLWVSSTPIYTQILGGCGVFPAYLP